MQCETFPKLNKITYRNIWIFRQIKLNLYNIHCHTVRNLTRPISFGLKTFYSICVSTERPFGANMRTICWPAYWCKNANGKRQVLLTNDEEKIKTTQNNSSPELRMAIDLKKSVVHDNLSEVLSYMHSYP